VRAKTNTMLVRSGTGCGKLCLIRTGASNLEDTVPLTSGLHPMGWSVPRESGPGIRGPEISETAGAVIRESASKLCEKQNIAFSCGNLLND
jgi:hypothetical protein